MDKLLIYAAADLHGKSSRFERIKENIIKHKPDVLVIAGDVERFLSPAKLLPLLCKLPLPVFWIRGNTDPRSMDRHKGCDNGVGSLHYQTRTFKTVDFTGVGGTFLLPFKTLLRLNEKRAVNRVKHLIHSRSVLVVHPPPKGTLDQVLDRFHAGSPGVKTIIEKYCPAVVICGHIHERPGLKKVKNTLVVNCSMGKTGAGALIQYGKGDAPVARMLS